MNGLLTLSVLLTLAELPTLEIGDSIRAAAEDVAGGSSSAQANLRRVLTALWKADQEVQTRSMHELSPYLKSADSRERVIAAVALARCRALDDRNGEMRGLAIHVLADVLLRGSSAERSRAAKVAAIIPSAAIRPGIGFVRDPTVNERAQSIFAFYQLVSEISAPDAIQREVQFDDLLMDEDAYVRAAATYLTMACDPIVAIQFCKMSRHDEAAIVRGAAVSASGLLCVIPAVRNEAREIWLGGITDPDESVQRSSLFFVMSWLPSELRVSADGMDLKRIAAALPKSSDDVRHALLEAVRSVGQNASSIVSELEELGKALETEDEGSRTLGILADCLGNCGSNAAGAVPLLTRLLESDDDELKLAATIAIIKIDGSRFEAHRHALMKAISLAEDNAVFSDKLSESADLIARNSSSTDVLIEFIAELMDSQAASVRIYGVRLAAQNAQREARISVLLQRCLEDPSPDVRMEAAIQLLHHEKSVESAIAEILRVASDDSMAGDITFRDRLAESIGQVDIRTRPQLVSVLFDIIKNPRDHFATKIRAIRSLRRAGTLSEDETSDLSNQLANVDVSWFQLFSHELLCTLSSVGSDSPPATRALLRVIARGTTSIKIAGGSALDKIRARRSR